MSKYLIPGVYIIESSEQGQNNVAMREGRILENILTMSGIKSKYYFITSQNQFNDCLSSFYNSQYRYLHISCHGNNHSFHFLFGDLTFDTFSDIINDKMKNRRLFISACEVVNDTLAKSILSKSQCYSIIGPFEKINFNDAAIIWASSYYLFFKYDNLKIQMTTIEDVLTKLTNLYKLNLQYYSHSRSKGIRLRQFIKGRKIPVRYIRI